MQLLSEVHAIGVLLGWMNLAILNSFLPFKSNEITFSGLKKQTFLSVKTLKKAVIPLFFWINFPLKASNIF
jgi:hypothetical protein